MTLPLDPPPSGLARIYFYRAEGKWFRALEPQVIVNGKFVGISRPGEAFFRDAKPGQYQVFTTADPSAVIYLEAKANRLHFVELEVILKTLGLEILPAERSEQQALSAMEGLSLIAAGT